MSEINNVVNNIIIWRLSKTLKSENIDNYFRKLQRIIIRFSQ